MLAAGSGTKALDPETCLSFVTVEWVNEPEAWLSPVVAALQRSANKCHPAAAGNDEAKPVVLRISVEANDHDFSKLFTHRTSITFADNPLWSSPLGRWLRRSGCLWRVYALLIFLGCLLISLPHSYRSVEMNEAQTDTTGCTVAAVKLQAQVLRLWSGIAQFVLLALFLLLVGETYNKEAFFKAFWTFDCMVISSNYVIAVLAMSFEHLRIAYFAGELEVENVVAHVLSRLLAAGPIGVWLATVDAWMISPRSKAIVISLALATWGWNHAVHVLLYKWSNIPLCLWWAYARGKPFAVVKEDYQSGASNPTTHRSHCCVKMLGWCRCVSSCFSRPSRERERKMAAQSARSADPEDCAATAQTGKENPGDGGCAAKADIEEGQDPLPSKRSDRHCPGSWALEAILHEVQKSVASCRQDGGLSQLRFDQRRMVSERPGDPSVSSEYYGPPQRAFDEFHL